VFASSETFISGDTFIILSRARGWWVVQRDPAGSGLVEPDTTKQGWVPAGCLLETNVPVATAIADATARTGAASGSLPSTPPGATPILPLSILSTSFPGIALTDYKKKGDEELDLVKDDSLRVFKRYNHWSYVRTFDADRQPLSNDSVLPGCERGDWRSWLGTGKDHIICANMYHDNLLVMFSHGTLAKYHRQLALLRLRAPAVHLHTLVPAGGFLLRVIQDTLAIHQVVNRRRFRQCHPRFLLCKRVPLLSSKPLMCSQPRSLWFVSGFVGLNLFLVNVFC
jgi:hypothetical protein